MDQEAIETKSQKPRWIKIAITAIKKRSSKGLIDSLAVERYREAVEIAQKQFFKGEKTTDMNAIKHATQPKKNVKHLDPNHTHTHTHTKKSPTNFIFQKQVKTVQ